MIFTFYVRSIFFLLWVALKTVPPHNLSISINRARFRFYLIARDKQQTANYSPELYNTFLQLVSFWRLLCLSLFQHFNANLRVVRFTHTLTYEDGIVYQRSFQIGTLMHDTHP